MPVTAFELKEQSSLSDFAIIILSETEFQDYLRKNNFSAAVKSFEKIEKLINSAVKLTNIDLQLRLALSKKTKRVADLLTNININSEIIEKEFNEIIKLIYECYYFFSINDSPEINYFLVDILQFEQYFKNKEWKMMQIEFNEMLDFFDCVAKKLQNIKINKNYNCFLLKYFRISLINLKNAVLDKDEKTLKTSIIQFKEIITKFQDIYSAKGSDNRILIQQEKNGI